MKQIAGPHRPIGTEHLFLALFAVEDCMAAKVLKPAGADAAPIHAKIAEQTSPLDGVLHRESRWGRPRRNSPGEMIDMHGFKRNADYLRDVVSMIGSDNWHWHKTVWKPRDVVIGQKDSKFSLDLGLARDNENFKVVKDGRKKAHCFVGGWELFESDDEHGTGQQWPQLALHGMLRATRPA
jgi:Clp amino terminal domain, pathogenicity island component